MELTGIRQKVFLDRYALKDKNGELIEHTPEDMWKRVARGIASNEKKDVRKDWEKKFYEVMKDFKFVPGGRILSGAGTNYQVTYFNCFVIPSPKDSRGGILDSLKQLVEIQSRSGGVGLNLSSLRPRGARVKKVNGVSSGPVTWAGLFSYATHDVVQQGGSRRGATMLMLWDWHPDIEEFITVKQDLSKINGANLSVCVSDAFMEAVKADADWDLVYPDITDPEYDKKWNGEIDQWRAMGKKVKVYKTVKAKYLWNLICEAAWRSAEPGLHFLERSNKRSNTWYFERLIATNPSLRAGTRVLTKEGMFPIERLEGKTFLVKNLDGKWSSAQCFLSGKNKELYKVTLNNGRELFATAEHKWPILLVGGGFGKVTTDKLKTGNILPFPEVSDIDFDSTKILSREEGFAFGWLYGDGWISDRGSKSLQTDVLQPQPQSTWTHSNYRNYTQTSRLESYAIPSLQFLPHHYVGMHDTTKELTLKRIFGFLFSNEDKVLADAILPVVNDLKKEKSSLKRAHGNTYTIQSTSREFAENVARIYGVDKKEKGLPSSVWQSGGDFIKGFVDGLISSDGFIAKNANRIVFTTKHKQLAEDFSSLISFYGIKSNIRKSEATKVKFPNQKEYSKIYERYDVTIDGHHAVNFAKIFTLSHPRKQQLLQRIIAEYKPSRALPEEGLIRIQSVEKTDRKEDVWDISVYDDTHCFSINHCITGNCGEQPLSGWSVCNLGAMNLSEYVRDGKFDYKSFGEDVKVAMRFLDNVIDKTYYFFKENEECAKDIRRTGLGIMGLGDALIKMKLRYGREDSLPVIEKIFQTLRDNAYDASADLAAEKGAFPKFDKKKFMQGYHIQTLPKKLQKKIKEQGVRNGVLLTIAPTGTTSIVSGVTSGIEPVYEFTFMRKWRGGEQIMYHPLYEEWKNAHPQEARPEYFVSANDLTPLEHVRVQAIAQKYIDSSISKTVNAPNAHMVEDVQTLYMAAYDMGLKGITYMRDGSRMGVLERIPDKKEEIKKEEATVLPPYLKKAPRPMVVKGATYQVQTPVGIAYVTINTLEDNEPLEIFINIGKAGSDVQAMAEALGRIISLNLRMASPLTRKERIKLIFNEMIGIGGARSLGYGPNRVRSLPDALAKAISQQFGFTVKNGNGNGNAAHPEDGTTQTAQEAKTILLEEKAAEIQGAEQPIATVASQNSLPYSTSNMDLCPECGQATMVHEEGCAKCYSCGHSEC